MVYISVFRDCYDVKTKLYFPLSNLLFKDKCKWKIFAKQNVSSFHSIHFRSWQYTVMAWIWTKKMQRECAFTLLWLDCTFPIIVIPNWNARIPILQMGSNADNNGKSCSLPSGILTHILHFTAALLSINLSLGPSRSVTSRWKWRPCWVLSHLQSALLLSKHTKGLFPVLVSSKLKSLHVWAHACSSATLHTNAFTRYCIFFSSPNVWTAVACSTVTFMNVISFPSILVRRW